MTERECVPIANFSHIPKITDAFRRRQAELAAPLQPTQEPDPDAVVIRNNRWVRAARPRPAP